MLNNLRKAADNIIFRILLGVIVFAFAFWGIGDVIRGNNDVDLVKFKEIQPIKLSEFYNIKKKLVQQIQRNSQEEITEDLLKQMNINNQVISKLISKRLTEAWIEMEKIMISDKLIADFIRTFPEFHDEQKHFSAKIFKNYIAGGRISEDEFYQNIKHEIAQSFLNQSIVTTVHIPKLMQDIMIDYLSQVKTIDLIKVTLSSQGNLEPIKPSDEDLVSFYEENKENFRLSEERKINYIIIDKNKHKNSGKVSEQDLLKSMEDSVAGGDSLSEIASQYKTSLKSIEGNQEILGKDSIFANFSTQIFEMQENELSYPAELQDAKAYVIFEIASVKEGAIPDLKSIKTEVAKLFIKKAYTIANMDKLKEFESNLGNSDFTILAKKFGYNITKETIQRSAKNSSIPEEVIEQILTIKQGDKSSVMIVEDTAYIGKVVKSTSDKKHAEAIRKTDLKEIDNNFKTGYLDAIFNYIYTKNNPEVRMELLGDEY